MTSTPRLEIDEDYDVYHYGALSFTPPEVACNHEDAENDPQEVTLWKQHEDNTPFIYLTVGQVMVQLPAEYRQVIYDKHQERYDEFLRNGKVLARGEAPYYNYAEPHQHDDPQWWEDEMKFWEICAEQMKPKALAEADDVVSLDKLLLGQR